MIYNKEVFPVLVSKKMQTFYDEYMSASYGNEEFREKISDALDKALSIKEE